METMTIFGDYMEIIFPFRFINTVQRSAYGSFANTPYIFYLVQNTDNINLNWIHFHELHIKKLINLIENITKTWFESHLQLWAFICYSPDNVAFEVVVDAQQDVTRQEEKWVWKLWSHPSALFVPWSSSPVLLNMFDKSSSK